MMSASGESKEATILPTEKPPKEKLSKEKPTKDKTFKEAVYEAVYEAAWAAFMGDEESSSPMRIRRKVPPLIAALNKDFEDSFEDYWKTRNNKKPFDAEKLVSWCDKNGVLFADYERISLEEIKLIVERCVGSRLRNFKSSMKAQNYFLLAYNVGRVKDIHTLAYFFMWFSMAESTLKKRGSGLRNKFKEVVQLFESKIRLLIEKKNSIDGELLLVRHREQLLVQSLASRYYKKILEGASSKSEVTVEFKDWEDDQMLETVLDQQQLPNELASLELRKLEEFLKPVLARLVHPKAQFGYSIFSDRLNYLQIRRYPAVFDLITMRAENNWEQLFDWCQRFDLIEEQKIEIEAVIVAFTKLGKRELTRKAEDLKDASKDDPDNGGPLPTT